MKSTNENGKTYWLYGGDLGSFYWQHDENGVADGVAELRPHTDPGAYIGETRIPARYYSNMKMESSIIKNEFDFTNLDQYDLAWELIQNGKKIKDGKFRLALAPHASKEVALPLPVFKSKPEQNDYLNVYV